MKVEIDAFGIYYKELNEMIRDHISDGKKEIILKNVNGQRYIGGAIRRNDVNITIDGVPGNDLASFMDGPTVRVRENAQDGICNTMNSGKVIVEGDAGDVLGYGMRGGKLFVKGDVGYRVGIHMKAYENNIPVIVAGGKARDFFGEYMAGGILVLLGMENSNNKKDPLVGDYVGTGMHGGTIYLRGKVDKYQLGREVGVLEPDEEDKKLLEKLLAEYCADLKMDLKETLAGDFIKLAPFSHRPYGKLYCNQP
jgi:glutamate synthase domain-containing protein 3